MSKISLALSSWYKMQNYNFPWREKKTVYSIWISEIMLQQTQVNTARSYFKSWMKKFPSVDKVASANIDTVLKLWEWLGYYQRAHNIYHTAQTIHKKYNGIFPETYEELISFVEDRPGHDNRYAIDSNKIKAKLGWEPETLFEDGIKKTVEWYISNLDWINKSFGSEYEDWFKIQYWSKQFKTYK